MHQIVYCVEIILKKKTEFDQNRKSLFLAYSASSERGAALKHSLEEF